MTKIPSRKLPEVFVLIMISQLRIHFWERKGVVRYPTTPSPSARGMRIFVLLIPLEVINTLRK